MSLLYYIISTVALGFIGYFSYQVVTQRASPRKSIVILVIGDVSRSPRMKRHCQSCLEHLPKYYDVHLVGFISNGFISSFYETISNEDDRKRLYFHNIFSYKYDYINKTPKKIHFAIYAFCKIMSEILSLFYILLNPSKISNLHFILMQNPPTIPTGWIARLSSWMRFGYLIIDWHNFGFTILALKVDDFEKSKYVEWYEYFEKQIGSYADAILCVTDTMKQFLNEQWEYPKRTTKVLKDRPTELFLKKMNAIEMSINDDKLFNEIKEYFPQKMVKELVDDDNKIKKLKQNDLWMISSTSWTPDEDLNMLLNEMTNDDDDNNNDERQDFTSDDDNNETKSNKSETSKKKAENKKECALSQLDKDISRILNEINELNSKKTNGDGAAKNARLILFITGKDDGQLKDQFISKYKELSLLNIRVYPIWLEDYTCYVHLLRYCDIGLCFHNSSSGLDLPMKVVDMYGVGIPVISMDYNDDKMYKIMKIDKKELFENALHELVIDYPISRATGLIFGDTYELYTQMLRCYRAFIGYYNNNSDNDDKQLFAVFQRNIEEFRKITWESEWQNVIQPLLNFESDLRAFWFAVYVGGFAIVASLARLYFFS